MDLSSVVKGLRYIEMKNDFQKYKWEIRVVFEMYIYKKQTSNEYIWFLLLDYKMTE